MRFELDQQMFKRLVQLYLLTFLASIGTVVYEVLDPTWSAFHDGFDILVDAHFGPAPEPLQTASLVLALAALVWHMGSAIGLLWFKRWARLGYWASLLPILALEILPLVSRPTVASPWSGWMGEFGAALFGAIVLLAYSSSHGRLWFMTPLDKLKETF